MNNEFKIVQINTQGIRNKLPEIQLLIHEQNPEILLLQETWLKLHDPLKISFPNYHIEESRRSGLGGGLATCIRNDINFISSKNSLTTKGNEMLSVEIQNQAGNNLEIINLYNNRSKNIDTNFISETLSYPNKIIIGDLNCKHQKWGSHKTNEGGKLLNKELKKYNISHSYHSQLE